MSLIACCNGQSAFGNAYNSLVSAQMEKSALAGVPANAKANAERLAGAPANTQKFSEAFVAVL